MSLRDPLMRVVYDAYIELWELRGGLGVLLASDMDHRMIHPPLVVRYVHGERFNVPL